MFSNVFTNSTATNIDLMVFLLCIGVALGLGILIAVLYMYKTKYSKSFVVTLAILPSIVAVIIMMVNGDLGAGVAVAGAFSLVRFRSVPGTAKEIGAIFLAMGTGLAIGMGYLGYAVIFVMIVNLVNILLNASPFGNPNTNVKLLTITIPESLDYSDIFDDLFETYTSQVNLNIVKTTNMGSLFKLTYEVVLIDVSKEKAFIDELRCRNGNLEISMAKVSNAGLEL